MEYISYLPHLPTLDLERSLFLQEMLDNLDVLLSCVRSPLSASSGGHRWPPVRVIIHGGIIPSVPVDLLVSGLEVLLSHLVLGEALAQELVPPGLHGLPRAVRADVVNRHTFPDLDSLTEMVTALLKEEIYNGPLLSGVES